MYTVIVYTAALGSDQFPIVGLLKRQQAGILGVEKKLVRTCKGRSACTIFLYDHRMRRLLFTLLAVMKNRLRLLLFNIDCDYDMSQVFKHV